MVTTMDDLIDELGGAEAVARLMNVTPGAVAVARHRGAFPHRWRVLLFQEATARRVAVKPELLGMATTKRRTPK
jgi:hypothetical protein